MVCNNLIDYEKIENLSNEEIPEDDLQKIYGNNYMNNSHANRKLNDKAESNKEKCPIFINVGRHDEKQKRFREF